MDCIMRAERHGKNVGRLVKKKKNAGEKLPHTSGMDPSHHR